MQSVEVKRRARVHTSGLTTEIPRQMHPNHGSEYLPWLYGAIAAAAAAVVAEVHTQHSVFVGRAHQRFYCTKAVVMLAISSVAHGKSMVTGHTAAHDPPSHLFCCAKSVVNPVQKKTVWPARRSALCA